MILLCILGTLGVLLAAVTVVAMLYGDDHDGFVFLFLWVCGINISALVFSLIAGLGSYNDHINSLAMLRTSSAQVSVQTERCEALAKQLTILRGSGPLTINADTPVASVASALAAAQNDLAATRQKIIDARRDIEARKLGLYSFIVRWIGAE